MKMNDVFCLLILLNLKLKEIERVEKIEVTVDDANTKTQLVMNRFISTPLNCAMRKFIKRTYFIFSN